MINWSPDAKSRVILNRYSEDGVPCTNVYNGETFAVPDGITVSPDSGTQVYLVHSVVRDVQQIVDEQKREAGVSASVGFFSASAETIKASGTVRSGQQIYARSKQRIKLHTTNLSSSSHLETTEEFQKDVAALPAYDADNADSVAKYERFFM